MLKMDSKLFFFFTIVFLSLSTVSGAQIYNEKGDFSVFLEKQTELVYNDNIATSFSFQVENLQQSSQNFIIKLPEVKGWDISINSEIFVLEPSEKRTVKINFVANSNFDYSENVVGPDIIKISQKEGYKGYFEFPVMISGDKENLSLKFEVEIDSRNAIPVEFNMRFSQEEISPVNPLRYTVEGQNILEPYGVDISLYLMGSIIDKSTDTFTKTNSYKIYEHSISSELEPGVYDVELRVNPSGDSSHPWVENSQVRVLEYENLIVEKAEENSFFIDKNIITIKNRGNVGSVYTEEIDVSWLKSLFLTSEDDYSKNENGVVFTKTLEKSETDTIEFSYNYIAIYLILVALIILGSYIYYRKISNPLDIETKIYGVRKVVHEGVKSLKVRIGFENIKEEQIETLKIIFRMPAYLNVKENSFLLVEPNHVLKGKNQYKLIWEFKKFEKDDSRIIGFTLENKRGVLGDIRLPDVEIEVKIGGKIRKYTQGFPTVRG